MIKIGLMCAGLALALSSELLSCVGARPLAMGGAFVAVADDVHATYWNPAGLAQLAPGQAESTVMHVVTNRDSFNYQDYLALASRTTGTRTSRYTTRRARTTRAFALGFSYILNRQLLEDTTNSQFIEDHEHWMWVSVAVGLSDRLMCGANARIIVDDTAEDYPITTDPAIDLGILYRLTNKFSAGLLVQDLNRPAKKYKGLPFASYVRNWRPGIAYRPTENSIIALDAYDLADEGGCRSLRLGGEIDLGEATIRAGYYGLWGSNVPRAVTFGIGTRYAGTSIDLAILSGDLDNTVIFSATRRMN